MFRGFSIGSAISFGLFSCNDAVSCARSDYSVEDVQEDGSEDDHQHDVQNFPQMDSYKEPCQPTSRVPGSAGDPLDQPTPVSRDLMCLESLGF